MMIEARVGGHIDPLEEELLGGFCQLDDTVNLHLDPSIESGIEGVHERRDREIISRRHQLQVSEDRPRELEVRIDKTVLEINGDRIDIVLWAAQKSVHENSGCVDIHTLKKLNAITRSRILFFSSTNSWSC